MSTSPTVPTAFGIVGTGSYLPRVVVDNDELASQLDIPSSWISERTGIHRRRFAAPDQATSDLAIAAAREAIDAAGVPPESIDVLIVGTSTPDQPQPATACLVQEAIGARRAAAFDVNAVCASFVFALETARGLLSADDGARYALVIGADVYSRQLDFADRRTCVLFGDGAGAVVLGPVRTGEGFLASRMITNGALYGLVGVSGGGSRRPLTASSLAEGEDRFRMDGREVRRFVEHVVPDLLDDVLKQSGLVLDDVDLVVPHQANAVLVRSCLAGYGVPLEKVHLTCPELGNTAAASVPITLDDAVRTRGLAPGSTVVLLGIGGGMSAGASLHCWPGEPA
jgi:3-oxoacyl-[acyl-carrier-protein] synthase-3